MEGIIGGGHAVTNPRMNGRTTANERSACWALPKKTRKNGNATRSADLYNIFNFFSREKKL